MSVVTAQKIEILGGAKISIMDTISQNNTVVVRDSSGTLAEMDLNIAFLRFLKSLPGGQDLLEIAGATVDNLLNNGYSPLDLYFADFPLDSIWVRFYEGGLVFYLDTLEEHPWDGLVSYPWPEGPWTTFYGPRGCNGIDLPIPNVDIIEPSSPGARIGDGLTNTIGIDTAACAQSEDAAVVCASLDLEGYQDWFLPSVYEMIEIRNNLFVNGYGYFGEFGDEKYQTSSESFSSAFVFYRVVSGQAGFTAPKSQLNYYRPVRAFK